MIAMVMCAGEGTRLRPLTYALAKPAVPLANRPALEYTLVNLRRHGIREAVVNLSYRAEDIRRRFGDGSRLGMKIHYSIEAKPLGTAGGVKKMEKVFRADPDPEFLVTSGDGLTDADFSGLIRFHRQRKSFATMGLKAVDQRFEYGVTVTDARGRIRKFVEKPSWSRFFSNRVNTGIYVFGKDVLGRIPPRRFYDFGYQVWPDLLKRGKPIYGLVLESVWTDIGNVTEYRRAQRELLEGKGAFGLPGRQAKPGLWIGEGARIGKGVRLEAPCLIGAGCRVENRARLGAYTVLGDGCRIGAGAQLGDSVLWEGAQVEAGARLERCIVGAGERVGKGLSLFDAIVLNIDKQTKRRKKHG